MLTEPRYIFRYYTASFHKFACSPKFWIEHTNIGRECCQESVRFAPVWGDFLSRRYGLSREILRGERLRASA
jgi:hypothetical protein